MKIITKDDDVRPPTQIANIQPLRTDRMHIINVPTKDEEDEVSDSFKKLTLNHDNFDSTHTISALNIEQPKEDAINRLTIDNDSDSDSRPESSNTEESGDEELVAKCPDKTSRVKKKTKQPRQQAVPYYEGAILNRYHHSGGTVRNGYSSCRQFDSQKTLSQPVTCTNLEYGDNCLTEEELFNALKTNLTKQQLCQLDQAISTIQSEIDTFEKNVHEEETYNNRADYDSAYETSSPSSSVTYSPMQNPRFSDTEVSPSYDIETSYNIVVPDSQKSNTFKTPSTTNNKDRSLPLNIPLKPLNPLYTLPGAERYQPVNVRSLPTSPIPQRRHCQNIAEAPETTVFEGKMTEPGVERLKLKLNKRHLEVEWIRVLLDQDFYHQNKNNETKLMEHMRRRTSPRYFEIFHARLEQIKQGRFLDLLLYTNAEGHSAISIAIYELYSEPIIARCITDVLTELGHIIDKVDSNGNSLIHNLVRCGDKYVHVLAELLNSKTKDEQPCFEVNRQNELSETALHIAAKTHSITVPTLSICKVLVHHCADVSIKDSQGLTPIHLAVKNSCDTNLTRTLLSSNFTSRAATIADNARNTALHYAAFRNDLPANHQMEIMCQLINSQWNIKAVNIENKTPIYCITEERRKVFKDYVNRK